MANYRIGDLITFSYPAIHLQGTRAHDKYPNVLVLHPNWGGLVHGLNFNYLTPDEINTIRMILDPMFEMKYREALQAKNPGAFNELESILTGKVKEAEGPHSRMAKITSPRAFYVNIIRPFIVTRGWDPYRLYRPEKMSGVRIVQPAAHMMGQDAYSQYKTKQSQVAQKVGQMLKNEPPEAKKGALQWFKDKFQHMRGPKVSGLQLRGPGALPGTRGDGEEE